MASYTMPLRNYIEMWSQDQPNLKIPERIEIGRRKLFDFDYPLFDEKYRKVFETHFIRNFYMREIGFETEALFKLRLENWLTINMPYFNQLFESEQIKYDPLINSKVDVEHTKKNDTEQTDNRKATQTAQTDSNASSSNQQTANTDNETFNRTIHADTPDDRLRLATGDGEGILEYASDITESKDTGNQKSTNTDKGNQTANTTGKSNSEDTLSSDINEIEDFIQHRVGKIGVQSYAEMVMKYRQSFIRIEREIFDEMSKLFMLVY